MVNFGRKKISIHVCHNIEIIVKNLFHGKCGGHGIANIHTYISLEKKNSNFDSFVTVVVGGLPFFGYCNIGAAYSHFEAIIITL